jgi:hypothetical protein
MHIAFKFKYIHSNGLFARLLYRINELSKLPLSLHQEGTEYRIETSGDQLTLIQHTKYRIVLNAKRK